MVEIAGIFVEVVEYRRANPAVLDRHLLQTPKPFRFPVLPSNRNLKCAVLRLRNAGASVRLLTNVLERGIEASLVKNRAREPRSDKNPRDLYSLVRNLSMKHAVSTLALTFAKWQTARHQWFID